MKLRGGALIASGDFLDAPPALGDCDGDGDFDLHDFGVFATCFDEVSPECADFDLDDSGSVDYPDFAELCSSWTGPVGGSSSGVIVTLWVRGPTASGSIGDRMIGILVGGVPHWSQVVTVVGLTASAPSEVRPGDEILLHLQPTGQGIGFDDATTTAEFADPSIPVTISYVASDVLVASPADATIIAGAGSSDASLALLLGGLSSLEGTLTATLDESLAVSTTLAVQLAEPGANLRAIAYDEAGFPALGGPLDEVRVMFDNGFGGVPSEADILIGTAHHIVAVVALASNAHTQSLLSLNATLKTYDSSGATQQDSLEVTLLPCNPGGDPILFISDVTVPLVAFNVLVDRDALGYTQVLPFQVSDNGFAVLIQEAQP